MKTLRLLILMATVLTAIHQVQAQRQYYRVASSYDALKLDKAPFAKAALTVDFQNTDSMSLAGKVFYKKSTTDGNQIWKAKDKSMLAWLESEELEGFIVTSVPVDHAVRFSLYYSYIKEKMRSKIPPAQTGKEEFDFLVDLSGKIVDPRTKTFYSVFYDLYDLNGGGFEEKNPKTSTFTIVSSDTIIYGKFYYFKKAENIYVRPNNYGPILLATLPNGSIMITSPSSGNTGYFAPTQALADKLLSEDYDPKTDKLKINAQYQDYYQNRDAREKEAKEANVKKTVTLTVPLLTSYRKDPVLEAQLRKKFNATTTVTGVFFLDENWQIMKNRNNEILSKYLFTAFLLKDGGKCYMRWWYIRYPYTGGGTYSNEIEFGATNEYNQPGIWELKDENGKNLTFNAGNWYEYDCKATTKK
ncbi:hypothetical protein BH10BAC4_BH10BAC4_13820 [soil metagenome]